MSGKHPEVKPTRPRERSATNGDTPAGGASGPRQRRRGKPENRPAGSRPGRSTNQNSVNTKSPKSATKWTVGGLTISVRALAGLVVVGMIAIVLVPTGVQWADQQREYRAVLAQVAAAEETKIALEDELANWSNREFLASQARTRLGFAEPGETQFSVVDPGSDYVQKTGVEPVLPEGPEKPWMMRLAETLQAADNPEPVAEGDANG